MDDSIFTIVMFLFTILLFLIFYVLPFIGVITGVVIIRKKPEWKIGGVIMIVLSVAIVTVLIIWKIVSNA